DEGGAGRPVASDREGSDRAGRAGGDQDTVCGADQAGRGGGRQDPRRGETEEIALRDYAGEVMRARRERGRVSAPCKCLHGALTRPRSVHRSSRNASSRIPSVFPVTINSAISIPVAGAI